MPEYTLNINIEGGSGSKSQTEKALDKVSNTKDKKSNTGKEVAKSVLQHKSLSSKSQASLGTAATVGIGAAATVVYAATDVAKYKLSHYGERYSYQTRQNKINNIVNTGKSALGVGATIAAGAAIGGPWGAAFAAIGAVFHEGYQMYERNQEWARKNHEYEISQTRLSERIGVLASDRNRGK